MGILQICTKTLLCLTRLTFGTCIREGGSTQLCTVAKFFQQVTFKAKKLDCLRKFFAGRRQYICTKAMNAVSIHTACKDVLSRGPNIHKCIPNNDR